MPVDMFAEVPLTGLYLRLIGTHCAKVGGSTVTLPHRKRLLGPSPYLSLGRSRVVRIPLERFTLRVEPLESRNLLAGLAVPVLEASLRPPSSGHDNRTPEEFASVGNNLFFTSSSASGTELWRVDRNTGGASIVADIMPGAGSSYPHYLTPVANRLFFVATDPQGMYLWQTDGTAESTTKVQAIGELVAVGRPVGLDESRIVIAIREKSQSFGDSSLWVSNGASNGTFKLTSNTNVRVAMDVAPVVSNGQAYFSAQNRLLGVWRGELWKTDGTQAGTTSIAAPSGLELGTFSSIPPKELTPNGAGLYFVSPGPAISFGTGLKSSLPDLWRLETSTNSLVRVTNSDASSGTDRFVGDFVFLTAWQGRVAFVASVGFQGGDRKVFVADTTGVFPLANTPPMPRELVASEEALYFLGDSYQTAGQSHLLRAAQVLQ